MTERIDAQKAARLITSGASQKFIQTELLRTPVGRDLVSKTMATFGSKPTAYQLRLMQRR